MKPPSARLYGNTLAANRVYMKLVFAPAEPRSKRRPVCCLIFNWFTRFSTSFSARVAFPAFLSFLRRSSDRSATFSSIFKLFSGQRAAGFVLFCSFSSFFFRRVEPFRTETKKWRKVCLMESVRLLLVAGLEEEEEEEDWLPVLVSRR